MCVIDKNGLCCCTTNTSGGTLLTTVRDAGIDKNSLSLHDKCHWWYIVDNHEGCWDR